MYYFMYLEKTGVLYGLQILS